MDVGQGPHPITDVRSLGQPGAILGSLAHVFFLQLRIITDNIISQVPFAEEFKDEIHRNTHSPNG